MALNLYSSLDVQHIAVGVALAVVRAYRAGGGSTEYARAYIDAAQSIAVAAGSKPGEVDAELRAALGQDTANLLDAALENAVIEVR